MFEQFQELFPSIVFRIFVTDYNIQIVYSYLKIYVSTGSPFEQFTFIELKLNTIFQTFYYMLKKNSCYQLNISIKYLHIFIIVHTLSVQPIKKTVNMVIVKV